MKLYQNPITGEVFDTIRDAVNDFLYDSYGKVPADWNMLLKSHEHPDETALAIDYDIVFI